MKALFKQYSYDHDDFMNRHLGEPVGFDAAGYLREKTWRWRWQRWVSCLSGWWRVDVKG